MQMPYLLLPEETSNLLGVPQRDLKSILPWIQLGKRTIRYDPGDIAKVWSRHRDGEEFAWELANLMERRRLREMPPASPTLRRGRYTLPNLPITGRIYFIEGAGLIKIGYAKSPQKRLSDLQIASAAELRLMAAMPGSIPLEKHLHKRFKDLHQRGEWFRGEEKLLRFIKEVARWKYKSAR